MIISIYQIDFIDAGGFATRLLNYGDPIDAAIEFSASQTALEFAPISAEWGKAVPNGAARRPLTWSRKVEHESHAAAAAWSIIHPASLPYFRPGKLRISIQGGQVWDMLDAVLLSGATKLHMIGKFPTFSVYQATAGRTVPVSGVPHYSGIETGWILTSHEYQTRLHSAM